MGPKRSSSSKSKLQQAREEARRLRGQNSQTGGGGFSYIGEEAPKIPERPPPPSPPKRPSGFAYFAEGQGEAHKKSPEIIPRMSVGRAHTPRGLRSLVVERPRQSPAKNQSPQSGKDVLDAAPPTPFWGRVSTAQTDCVGSVTQAVPSSDNAKPSQSFDGFPTSQRLTVILVFSMALMVTLFFASLTLRIPLSKELRQSFKVAPSLAGSAPYMIDLRSLPDTASLRRVILASNTTCSAQAAWHDQYNILLRDMGVRSHQDVITFFTDLPTDERVRGIIHSIQLLHQRVLLTHESWFAVKMFQWSTAFAVDSQPDAVSFMWNLVSCSSDVEDFPCPLLVRHDATMKGALVVLDRIQGSITQLC